MELSVLLWPFWVTRVPHCQLSASNLGSVHKSTDVMDESIISNELGSNIFGNGLHCLICGGKHSEKHLGLWNLLCLLSIHALGIKTLFCSIESGCHWRN